MEKWHTDTVPDCEKNESSKEVLVTVERGQYRTVVKAVYIPYRNCTVEDMCWNMVDGVPDDWEYVEEEDTWWVPQGWYETAEYFGELEYGAITDKVVAWTELPEGYKS